MNRIALTNKVKQGIESGDNLVALMLEFQDGCGSLVVAMQMA